MALCPGLPGWAGTRKVKPIWILLKQETVSGSATSWSAICKSAPRCRHNHASTPPLSFLSGRMPFLLPNQQRQSTEGKIMLINNSKQSNDQYYGTILTSAYLKLMSQFLSSCIFQLWCSVQAHGYVWRLTDSLSPAHYIQQQSLVSIVGSPQLITVVNR